MGEIYNINTTKRKQSLKLNKAEKWIYINHNSDIVIKALSGVVSLVFNYQQGSVLLQKDEELVLPPTVNTVEATPITLSAEVLEMYI